MLRKCTLFFDRSFEYLGDNTIPFENARKLCVKLTGLVQDISILRILDEDPIMVGRPDRCLQWVVEKLKDCFGDLQYHDFFFDKNGKDVEEALVSEFVRAAKHVYRLENIFRYPADSEWDDSVGHRVYQRWFYLDLKFFVKNERKPFYVMSFMFGLDGDNVHYLRSEEQFVDQPKS